MTKLKASACFSCFCLFQATFFPPIFHNVFFLPIIHDVLPLITLLCVFFLLFNPFDFFSDDTKSRRTLSVSFIIHNICLPPTFHFCHNIHSNEKFIKIEFKTCEVCFHTKKGHWWKSSVIERWFGWKNRCLVRKLFILWNIQTKLIHWQIYLSRGNVKSS